MGEVNAPKEGTPLWFVLQEVRTIAGNVNALKAALGEFEIECAKCTTEFKGGLETTEKNYESLAKSFDDSVKEIKKEMSLTKSRRFKIMIAMLTVSAALIVPLLVIILSHVIKGD